MCLLYNIGKPDSSVLVCSQQPMCVEYHVSFIVDFEALKSKNDIKCDDARDGKTAVTTNFGFREMATNRSSALGQTKKFFSKGSINV